MLLLSLAAAVVLHTWLHTFTFLKESWMWLSFSIVGYCVFILTYCVSWNILCSFVQNQQFFYFVCSSVYTEDYQRLQHQQEVSAWSVLTRNMSPMSHFYKVDFSCRSCLKFQYFLIIYIQQSLQVCSLWLYVTWLGMLIGLYIGYISLCFLGVFFSFYYREYLSTLIIFWCFIEI